MGDERVTLVLEARDGTIRRFQGNYAPVTNKLIGRLVLQDGDRFFRYSSVYSTPLCYYFVETGVAQLDEVPVK